jgi:hypothetical protein
MLVADIAPVLADAVLPAPVVPDRQAAAIRAVIGACRRVLRWLALRGDPPGNRCLPDIVPSRGAAAANAAGRRGFNPSPGPTTSGFLRRSRKNRPAAFPPPTTIHAGSNWPCRSGAARPARGSASRALRSI